MSNSKLHQYLNELSQVFKTAEADDRCRMILADYGFEDFTYTFYSQDFIVSKDIKYDCKTEFLNEWHHHFANEDYEMVDSIGKQLRTSVLPVQWDLKEQFRHSTGKEKKMYDEAIDYGLQYGLSIPIHGPNNEFAILVLHGHPNEENISLNAELYQIALFYHQKITELLSQQGKSQQYYLTQREQECLIWTAHNLTAIQVADQLNISTRTVSFHIENAIHKLEVKNKYQAVAKAINLNLIQI